MFLSPRRSAGGFSGRGYGGYLFSISSSLSVGPEVGFSFYPPTKKYKNLSKYLRASATGAAAVDIMSTVNFTHFVKVTGYGADLLANVTFIPVERAQIYLKPGVQVAYEHVSSTPNLDFVGQFTSGTNNILINYNLTRTSTTSSQNILAPELIFGAGWQVSPRMPLFLGAAYQYVFSTNDTNRIHNNVSSRSMVTINAEYHFS